MLAEGRSWTARLLSLLIALQAWTVVGLGFFLLDPGGVDARLPCASRILAGPACEQAQATLTSAWLTFHYWPLIAAILAGYGAVVLVFLRGPRPARRRPTGGRPARRSTAHVTSRGRR